MTLQEQQPFLVGVIEGFYGPPWSAAQRRQLFDWMAQWGLNTYLYAPKDDLKHRAIWREPYSAAEAATLGELIRAADQRGVRFIYAISPGLDIRYGEEAELALLQKRFEQMLALGCRNFALLLDDLPDRAGADGRDQHGSYASAHCHLANSLFRWTREQSPNALFLFCPTPYCGRMAEGGLGGDEYLSTVGLELEPDIDVLWTGPEIISREITLAHVRELRKVLRRKPVIWDNLHANDYDGCRFFCGPYAGRSPRLREEVRGLLSNPNCEFPLNYVPLRTLADFAQSAEHWDARQAWLNAMREWLPQFATVGQPVTLEDFVLFGDCYYLPHEAGPEAQALFAHAQKLLGTDAAERGEEAAAFRSRATRLREFCARMTELRDRELFHALSRRIWELREELDLLERCVNAQASGGSNGRGFSSDFHLPGTYRGGLVRQLQQLLVQQPDGSFVPATQPAMAPAT